MVDLHEMAEAVSLEDFARLPLVDMARVLSSSLEPPPCKNCRPDSLCWVHRGNREWHPKAQP